MKIIKQFGGLFIVISLFLLSCENKITNQQSVHISETVQRNPIAKIEGEQIFFFDKEALKAQLQKELAAVNKTNVVISDLFIETTNAVDNTSKQVIQLIGSTDGTSVQVSLVLEKEENEFFIKSGKTLLVCESCLFGCSPRRKANGDGYCTTCENQEKKCTKTETFPAFTEN